MTFVPTADIRINYTIPPFLPFWAWSVLVHIGTVTLFSFVHFADKIERTNSTVQVTLVEASFPVHKSQANRSKSTEATAKRPHLINTRRPIPPVPTQEIPTPQGYYAPFLKTPVVRTTLTQIATSVKSQERRRPTQRRVLQDHRATDHLNLRNYLKVAQRQTVQRSGYQGRLPSTVQTQVASNSLNITSAMPLGSIPMEIQRPITLHSKKDNRDTIKPNILLAKPSNSTGFSKSKAKFGGAVPLVYPLIAKKNEWEGTVRIRVVVQPSGFPETISIKKTSGHTVLDNAAIEAIRKTRFIPAKDGNIPVRSIVEIPIKFDLKNPT